MAFPDSHPFFWVVLLLGVLSLEVVSQLLGVLSLEVVGPRSSQELLLAPSLSPFRSASALELFATLSLNPPLST